MMETPTVQYDNISSDPRLFREVFERQLSLADAVRSGEVKVDQGAVEAKTLFAATKTLEIDLHTRVFENRLQPRELSGGKPEPGERSQPQLPGAEGQTGPRKG